MTENTVSMEQAAEIFSDTEKEKEYRKKSFRKACKEWFHSFNLNHIVVLAFLLLMLCWFPRYSKYSYNTLAQDKLDFFVHYSLIFGEITIGIALLRFLLHPKKSLLSRPQWFSVTDVAVLGYGLVAYISWRLSSYPEEAYLGSDYRHHGLLIVLMYVLVYFMISRYNRWNEFALFAFLAAGSYVLWLALQNLLGNDVLKFSQHSAANLFRKSTSTIGNLNFFSSYTCMYTAAASMLFLRGKKWYWNLFYAVFTLFGFGGLLVGSSDSGLLGVGAVLALMPMFVRNFRELGKYLIILSLLFYAGKFVGHYVLQPGIVPKYAMSGFSTALISGGKGLLFAAVLTAIGAVCLLLSLKLHFEFKKWLKWVWLGMLAALGLVVLYLIYDLSVLHPEKEIGALTQYFRFDDNWGTYRGYAWRVLLQEMKQFKTKDLLVGMGMDTAEHIYLWKYYAEMIAMFHEFFENAHNEYLQYLATIGIFGVGCYITAIASCVARGFWKCKHSAALAAVTMAVLCYAVQGIVNISQTMTTPIFFVLLGMTEGAVRRYTRQEKWERLQAEKKKSKKSHRETDKSSAKEECIDIQAVE